MVQVKEMAQEKHKLTNEDTERETLALIHARLAFTKEITR